MGDGFSEFIDITQIRCVAVTVNNKEFVITTKKKIIISKNNLSYIFTRCF